MESKYYHCDGIFQHRDPVHSNRMLVGGYTGKSVLNSMIFVTVKPQTPVKLLAERMLHYWCPSKFKLRTACCLSQAYVGNWLVITMIWQNWHVFKVLNKIRWPRLPLLSCFLRPNINVALIYLLTIIKWILFLFHKYPIAAMQCVVAMLNDCYG